MTRIHVNRIHGTGITTYIYHENQPFLFIIYSTIHESNGLVKTLWIISAEVLSVYVGNWNHQRLEVSYKFHPATNRKFDELFRPQKLQENWEIQKILQNPSLKKTGFGGWQAVSPPKKNQHIPAMGQEIHLPSYLLKGIFCDRSQEGLGLEFPAVWQTCLVHQCEHLPLGKYPRIQVATSFGGCKTSGTVNGLETNCSTCPCLHEVHPQQI